jgi:hypothetical protein
MAWQLIRYDAIRNPGPPDVSPGPPEACAGRATAELVDLLTGRTLLIVGNNPGPRE